MTIETTEPMRRTFELGYCDWARVFLDGRLIYADDRKDLSQDYR